MMMLRFFVFTAMAMALAEPASAQPRSENDGWRITVGGGAFLAPNYEGDDAYRLSAVPNLQVAYGESFFASIQEGVGYRFLNTETVKAGPIVRFAFPRKEDGKQPFALTGRRTTDLRGLGNVDLSVELGGFVEYELDPLSFRAEARQAASGHKGLIAELSAQVTRRVGMLGSFAIMSVGPRVRLVDASYNKAYFGVTTAQSAASGLPAYRAGGGLYSYGVATTVIFPLPADPRWALVVLGGYERLAGDAGSSPLVRLRGSVNQGIFGLFASRSF